MKLFFALFFTSISTLYSQNSFFAGSVYSRNSGFPIEKATVNITYKNKLLTCITNSMGDFKFLNIKEKEVQSIEISHLSYMTESRNLIIDSIFYLKEKTNELDEVILSSSKEKMIYDLPLTDKLLVEERNFNWGDKMAVFIPWENKNSNKKIKKLLFAISDFGGVKGLKYLPFMVNLYAVDTLTKLPGKSLIDNKGILISKKDNKKWVEVDVAKYNFEIPKEGIFIAFEILSEENYKVSLIRSYNGVISAVPAIKAYSYNKKYIRKSYLNAKIWTIPIDRSGIWVEEKCHYLMDIQF